MANDTFRAGFPTTRWSLVAKIQSRDEEEARHALGEICRRYWMPLYQFARWSGDSPAEAEDTVQGFFHQMIEKTWLENLESNGDRGPGRFRSFLLTCLKRYRANQHRYARAQKRGGRAPVVSIDREMADRCLMEVEARDLTPEEWFDRAWALNVIRMATEEVRAVFEAKGDADYFRELEPLLAWNGADQSYASLARQIGVTEGKLKTDIRRLRQRVRNSIREQVALTIDPSSGVSVDEELDHLMHALR